MDIVAEQTPNPYVAEANEPIFTASAVNRDITETAPDRAEADPTAAPYSRVRKDLYLSFMVSQGDDFGQADWLRAAAAHYKSTWSDEDLAQLPAVLNRMDATIETTNTARTGNASEQTAPRESQLRISGKHIPTVEKSEKRSFMPTTREGQFSRHWNNFRTNIQDAEPTTEGEKTLSLPASAVAKLAGQVLDRDIQYQGKDKPRTGGYIFAPNDAHASLFKTHVLDGVSTGSEAYDAIFRTMGALLDATKTDETLRSKRPIGNMLGLVGSLKAQWEENHPGESFGFDVPEVNKPDDQTTLAAVGALAVSQTDAKQDQ